MANVLGLGAGAAFLLVAVFYLDLILAEALRDTPAWIYETFRVINRLGKADWYLWPSGLLALGAALLAWRSREEAFRRLLHWLSSAAAFVFVAVAVPGLIVNLIKLAVGRARPKLLFTEGYYGLSPFSFNADYYSFPSGHTQTAFCAALALGLFWPRARPYFLVAAVLVAVARMVLGAHFLSDVMASALLSIVAVGWLEHACRQRGLVFTAGANGARRLPPEGRWWRRRLSKMLPK